MYDPLDLRDLVVDEFQQRKESGYQVESLGAAVAEAAGHADSQQLTALLDALEQTSRRPDWNYREPTALAEIEAEQPGGGPGPAMTGAPGDLADRIRGAWLGRCAGCALGKPVEGYGWNRAKIREYLISADAFPLTDYVPVSDEAAAGITFHPSWTAAARGRINGIPRDDDIDYTILGVHLLETYSDDFSAGDVGREWLDRIPIGCTYTAERAAYRNLVDGYTGDDVAVRRNPYREWIGAQIRADVFGYASPGDPARAARLAWQDATLSHIGNGVYGEMWAAALVASALTADDARQALDRAIKVVPAQSRLAEAIGHVMELHASGGTWEASSEYIETRWPYAWVHTINNAAAITAALLWGKGDFSRSIGLVVESGLDTDSDGATVGSVAGALAGAPGIPAHWTAPFGDVVHSAIQGYDGASLEDLIQRTLRLVRTP
jgi:ADP-ribosylglycohydrolase